MSLMSDLITIMAELQIPTQVGDFQSTGAIPDMYAVILPLIDDFEAADDMPDIDVEQVSIELYSKGDWHSTVKSIRTKALAAGMYPSLSRYITRETDTRYFHYSITLEKNYAN